MAQNITLLGASYSDVPAVQLPKTGGGTALFADPSITDALAADVWYNKTFLLADGSVGTGACVEKVGVLRPDAELIKTYSADDLIVEDLKATIPAYSSSAVTAYASETLSETVTLDYTAYNYYIVQRFLTIPVYNTTTIAKSRNEYAVGSSLYEVVEIPASAAPPVDGKTYTSRSVTTTSAGACYRMLYWSTTSAVSLYTTTTYGVSQVVTAPSVSSGKLTIKTPYINMRGSSTYLSSTVWGQITDIRRQYVIEVWRAPKSHWNYNGWGHFSNTMKIFDCISNGGNLT